MPQLASTRVQIGVDIVGVERVRRLATENPDILTRLFTRRELEYCQGKRRCYDHLAARFAGKEAVLKAFGTGLNRPMQWTDVEIINDATGRPHVHLSGEFGEWVRTRGFVEPVSSLDISLSHSDGMAIAQVIAVWGSEESSS